MNKEKTLKEAAEWINKKFNGKGVEVKIIDWDKNETNNYPPSKLLEEYAKVIQERMYSEEEVLQLLENIQGQTAIDYNDNFMFAKEWFEQFKK